VKNRMYCFTVGFRRALDAAGRMARRGPRGVVPDGARGFDIIRRASLPAKRRPLIDFASGCATAAAASWATGAWLASVNVVRPELPSYVVWPLASERSSG
jgi:hypothetical protein